MDQFNVLAIECATDICSVAISCGELCWQVESRAPEKHSQTIFPMVREVLQRSSRSGSSISLVAVGVGPGSFTGVRTAVGVAQGLAFGWGKPLVGVNTLHAMACAVGSQTRQRVLAAMDARMHEMYVSVLDICTDSCQEVQPPAVLQPAQLRDWLESPVDAVVGCRLDGFKDDLATNGVPIRRAEPSAKHVGKLGQQLFLQGIDAEPQYCQPLYVRNQVALTIAQRSRPEYAG